MGVLGDWEVLEDETSRSSVSGKGGVVKEIEGIYRYEVIRL